ncbi:MAG: prepilin peptidase [Planctomycetes bacterium]|nr:prepilin peptidase [Planctomycetota bacterium]
MLWLNHASDVTAVQWGVVLGASLAAALTDLRNRRIPNRLTMPLALVGLAVAFYGGGWANLGAAGAAYLVLALPYILLFLLAGGGAGDAKMMGATGPGSPPPGARPTKRARPPSAHWWAIWPEPNPW